MAASDRCISAPSNTWLVGDGRGDVLGRDDTPTLYRTLPEVPLAVIVQ